MSASNKPRMLEICAELGIEGQESQSARALYAMLQSCGVSDATMNLPPVAVPSTSTATPSRSTSATKRGRPPARKALAKKKKAPASSASNADAVAQSGDTDSTKFVNALKNIGDIIASSIRDMGEEEPVTEQAPDNRAPRAVIDTDTGATGAAGPVTLAQQLNQLRDHGVHVVDPDEDSDDEEAGREPAYTTECESLDYGLDTKVIKDVLGEKNVPVYKLLPGYESQTREVRVNNAAITFGDDPMSRKLSKQVLSINQLVFGLMKYKKIVTLFPNRVADIDRHIAHVLTISSSHRGNAYFFYHQHVWSHFFGASHRTWGFNWLVPDAAGMSVAQSRASGDAGSRSYCSHCDASDHDFSNCPFVHRHTEGNQRHALPSRRIDLTSATSRRAAGGTQGGSAGKPAARATCNFFNRSGCGSAPEVCKFSHECARCRSQEHGAKDCTWAGY